MMKKIPKEEAEKLNRAKNAQCVFCGSSDVSYEGAVIDAGTASQEACCSDCDEKWIEYYDLVRVERDEC